MRAECGSEAAESPRRVAEARVSSPGAGLRCGVSAWGLPGRELVSRWQASVQ